MFASVNVRVSKLQQLLTGLTQRTLCDLPLEAGIADERLRIMGSAVPEPEARLGFMDPVRLVLSQSTYATESPTFCISGLLVRSITIQEARSSLRAPFNFRARVTRTTPHTTEVRTQTFSTGVELSCALDVRIEVPFRARQTMQQTTPSLQAFLRMTTTWVFGTNPSELFELHPTPREDWGPFEVRISTDRSPLGLVMPAVCDPASPLCLLVRDLRPVLWSALQASLRQVPRVTSGLSDLLPNRGTPLNHAVFVSRASADSGMPPDPNSQLCYVAQLQWLHGAGRFRAMTEARNSATEQLWRGLLTTRPEVDIPADRDVLADVDGEVLSAGLLPSVTEGIVANLSTIEFGLWEGLYFGGMREVASGSQAYADAETVRSLFLGSAELDRIRWTDIPEPWRTIVERVAASRQDTANLVGFSAFPGVQDALVLLERRLFASLAYFFELREIRAEEEMRTDTMPPSPPPTMEEIVRGFENTSFPFPAGVARDSRQAYEDIRQARHLLATQKGGATREQREQALDRILEIFANCPAFTTYLNTTGARAFGALDTPRIQAARSLDEAMHAVKESLLLSRKRVPDTFDPATRRTAQAEIDAARTRVAEFGLGAPHGRPCRAFSALAHEDGPEPIHINMVDILRLISTIEEGKMRLGGTWAMERILARGLRQVTLEQAPTMTIEPDLPGVSFRIRTRLRLVGIIEGIVVVPGDDLIVNADTTVTLELISPPAATRTMMASDPRNAPGPSRSLRLTITPRVSIPVDEQPTGGALLLEIVGLGALADQFLNGIAPVLIGVALGILVPTDPIYSDPIAERIPGFSSFLEPLFRRIAGESALLSAPVTMSDPHRLVYTVADFERKFLQRSDGGGVDVRQLLDTSIQSTLDTVRGTPRFTALIPAMATSAAAAWGSSSGLDSASAVMPVIDFDLYWDVCSLLSPEGRATAVVRVVVSVVNTILGSLPLTISGVEFRDAAFAMFSRQPGLEIGLSAVLRAGDVDREATFSIQPGAFPSRDRPTLVPAGQRFVMRRVVRPIALLDVARSATMVQVAVTTNMGLLVADLSMSLVRLEGWRAFLEERATPEVASLSSRLAVGCDSRRIERMRNIRVREIASPFPPQFSHDGTIRAGDDWRVGERIPMSSGVLRPAPDLGEPRPIVERLWIGREPVAPLAELDSIADLALRSMRLQS